MVLQLLASEGQLSPLDCQDLVDVVFYLFVVPGDHRADGEVFQFAAGSKLFDLIDKACLLPVLVHEHNRLG